MFALILAAQLHFGPTWSPYYEIPIEHAETKQVTILRTRYNYREHKWSPPLSPAQRVWYKKHGHILLNWRWSLKEARWVRKPKGQRLCLT